MEGSEELKKKVQAVENHITLLQINLMDLQEKLGLVNRRIDNLFLDVKSIKERGLKNYL